jgi:MFS family permease
MTSRKQSQDLFRFPRIIVLMVSFSFLTLAAVVFTPAYPELSRQFHLSDSQAQWMMTLFLFGTAIGRLPYGPLANRFGRKKTLFLGLFVSLIGTLFTIFADTYLLICIGRFIQALGCAVTLKIGYTMIGDLHAGSAATKMLAYSLLVYAILPGIGATISGFLTPYYGWRGGFWFFLIFTILFIFSCTYLPETIKKKDLEALRIKKIVSGYIQQFKNLDFVLWSCLMGLSTAVIFIFSQEAPFIAIDVIGLSTAAYGLFYLVPAIGIAGGSLFTVWLADRVSPLMGMLMGILLILFGALFMGSFFMEKWINGWALFIPQTVVQFGDALLYTFASSLGLSEAKDKSNASSVMLFINSLGGMAGTFLVGMFAPRSLLALSTTFVIISAIMLFIWLKLWTKTRAHLR